MRVYLILFRSLCCMALLSGRTQSSEVANIMSVSRVTVVKYLHLAREKGFVNISLDSSVFSTIDYSIRIKAKFNLNNVLILPDEEKNKSQQTSNMNRERLAKAGAMYLSQIISNDDILGVAWGRTIHKLGHYLPTKTLENVTVLQMIGAVAPDLIYYCGICRFDRQ